MDELILPPETKGRRLDDESEDKVTETDSIPELPVEDAKPYIAPQENITVLTNEERESFRSLITVGRRSKTFELFDHQITITTLNTDDEIRVGMACKEHQDSQGFARAYQSAIIAAAIRTVDGKSFENTLIENPSPDALFQDKLARVRQYYPLVIQFMYSEYMKLEAEFAELAAKLGKL